ncbi:B3/4 domain-containing protein [Bacillus alkalicellulosilyticus]|uniref:B3/B4 domain-containing protein n=1 Tax=Alkalihalobacterium alkalicellulosilyticum TaxID=1912214 RepID=UPI0009986280|nr:phenylalanine--tRNA ligase beta subunit-related protein [Bacillus alkalicellulosilyticus]
MQKLSVTIAKTIKEVVPQFQLGVITYQNITVSDSPQMLKGRLRFYQEELQISLENQDIGDIPSISETRSILKKLGIDTSRYRPSSEALLRRIKKGQLFNPINSAVDLNNFFSIQYQIPLGIYDLDMIEGDVELRLGKENESYLGINGRDNDAEHKLISADAIDPFGSPVVDSKRTIITEKTKNALHLVYCNASLTPDKTEAMLESIVKMFTDVHGGSAEISIIR